MEVDIARKRIALTMRLDDVPGEESNVRVARNSGATNQKDNRGRHSRDHKKSAKQPESPNGTMAELFLEAKLKQSKKP
jgi:uncharacterized protein